MSEFVHIIIPLFAFMLIPVWVPLAAMAVGSIADRFRPSTEHPALVEAAGRRTAWRDANPEFAS